MRNDRVVLGLLVCLAALGSAPQAGAATTCTVTSGTATCTATAGGETAFVVPQGVTAVTATAVGAQGAADYPSGTNAGGLGARATAPLSVTPGQTLYLEVAVGGGDGGRDNTGFLLGGVGGGASDVRTCSTSGGLCGAGTTLASRLLVAGGGGGTGAWGAGGGNAGTTGTASPGANGTGGNGCNGGGATGATRSAPGTGGAGGAGGSNGANGAAAGGAGGAGGGSNNFNGSPGGGGGGGWFGGGGGGACRNTNQSGGGGGGGSSNAAPGVTGATFTQSTAGTAPSVSVSFAATAPAITSGSSTTFTTGQAGSFTVTATGAPVPALSRTGALPSGVSFTDNGNGTATLSGTPAAGSGGSYPLTFTAANGATPNATQNFTLTVNQPPAITSASNATFRLGQAGSFSVTTTGRPTSALSRSGTLPSGVTFVDNGNGTGTLSGTPAAGTAGNYPLTFTAANGVAPNATQNFTLTVSQPPAITSASSTTFTAGQAGTFTVTTSGTPTPALSRTGALPSGVTFTDNGDGTATLSGTPAAGSGGSYPLTVTAANGVAPNATQNFTLAVDQAPAITSASAATFTTGQAGSFTVTTTGHPVPGLSRTGALPSGVTFADNGNGTATLSGTPAAGSGGSYPLTLTAANGVAPNATQNFTLTVDQAPAITSAAGTTFHVGQPGSFSVTTTGHPAPSLSLAGALPAGVTFADDGNGTATLSGTPGAGSAARYTVTITAANGTSPDATQSFTLDVDQAPAVTSSARTTFTTGQPGSFTVTASGRPIPSLSSAGALPPGVTFVDNGNGTATLSGTPAAGSAGRYPLTITAANGVAPDGAQGFTLDVEDPPAAASPPASSPAPAPAAAPPPAAVAERPTLADLRLVDACVRRTAAGRVRVRLNVREKTGARVQIRVDRAVRAKATRDCGSSRGNSAPWRYSGAFRRVTTLAEVATKPATAGRRRVTLTLRLAPGLYRITMRVYVDRTHAASPVKRFLRVVG